MDDLGRLAEQLLERKDIDGSRVHPTVPKKDFVPLSRLLLSENGTANFWLPRDIEPKSKGWYLDGLLYTWGEPQVARGRHTGRLYVFDEVASSRFLTTLLDLYPEHERYVQEVLDAHKARKRDYSQWMRKR